MRIGCEQQSSTIGWPEGGGLCAHDLNHRGNTEGYPCAIQSLHPISRERAGNSAQHSLSSLTPLRPGGFHSPPTQGYSLPEPRAPSLRTSACAGDAARTGQCRRGWWVYPGWVGRHSRRGCIPTMGTRVHIPGCTYPPCCPGTPPTMLPGYIPPMGERLPVCAEGIPPMGERLPVCAECTTNHGREATCLRRVYPPPWERG